MKTRLVNYMKAAFPGLAIRTAEEQRAITDVLDAAKEVKKKAATWSATEGLVFMGEKPIDDTEDLEAACRAGQRFENAVLIFRDVHLENIEKKPSMARSFRDLLMGAPANGICVVVVAPEFRPWSAIAKLMTVMDYSLPSIKDLQLIAEEIAKSAGKKIDITPDVLRALSGLSTSEAENALSLSIIETKTFSADVIYREKIAAVRKSDMLEIIDPDPRGLASVGGLENLKSWILRRKRAFTPDAEKYGLPQPKGILLVGVPGCLSGDTEVFYLRGNRVSGRSISLKDFYAKFNGIPTKNPWRDLTLPTFLHSLDADGRVFYNRVISVIEAGVKPVIRLEFGNGTSLRLTANHPIATPGGNFVPAGDLKCGDKVLARGSMKPVYQGGKNLQARPPRVIVNVKYHPYGAYKEVDGYEYTRVARARLVVEAHMNDMDYADFVHCLKHNQDAASTLKFLPQNVDVHHMDENTLNDDLSNLLVLSNTEHAREHGKFENFNTDYLQEIEVTKVSPDGDDMTYDIQMDFPANNFCANGIIVHNTGKSLSAKAIGTALGIPTLRLDLGKLFNSLVGASESATRDVLDLAGAMAPVCLWCDEIEKGLAGSGGSGNNDSGVTKRVFGTILNWMQERKQPVFIIATANDVSALPPEFLRKGRFDELFALDLPTESERRQITEVLLKRVAVPRDPAKFEIAAIAKASEGFTGAEIEACINEAANAGFADDMREFTTLDILQEIKNLVPQSKTSKEQIDAIRKWAQTRARPASAPETAPAEKTLRKFVKE